MRNIYGYIRVSTITQRDDRQWLAMENFGIPKECIFVDKQSGKDFDRPAYREMMTAVKSGDTVVVKSLDRLGRNYDEMMKKLDIITKQKDAAIVVIDLSLLDTRNKYCDDLTTKLISNLVIQVFSYVAETERNMIHQRTMEGLAAARARGVKFGRNPVEKPDGYEALRKQRENSEIFAHRAAIDLGGTLTFLKRVGCQLMSNCKKCLRIVYARKILNLTSTPSFLKIFRHVFIFSYQKN